MGCNPLLWLFIGGSNCPWFAQKEGFTLASVSCWGPPLFLVFFVIVFWRQQMCQAHLVIPLLQPWNQPFLQGALIPFTGEWCSEAKMTKQLSLASRKWEEWSLTDGDKPTRPSGLSWLITASATLAAAVFLNFSWQLLLAFLSSNEGECSIPDDFSNQGVSLTKWPNLSYPWAPPLKKKQPPPSKNWVGPRPLPVLKLRGSL